jgi:hypothetical protein
LHDHNIRFLELDILLHPFQGAAGIFLDSRPNHEFKVNAA